MQANPAEKANVAQCATILEEMLLAVENSKTDGFSLVDNEAKNKQQNFAFDANRMRRSVDSIEDVDE